MVFSFLILVGIKQPLIMLVVAMAGASGAGAFIISAGSAMATSVSSQEALLRGGSIGLAAGFVSGGVVLLIERAITSRRS